MSFTIVRRVGIAFLVLLWAALVVPGAVRAAIGPADYYRLPGDPLCRVFDTFLSPPLVTEGVPRTIPIFGGPCPVPTEAVAVALNVTVVNPSEAGSLTLYPPGATPTPALGAAAISFEAGLNRAMMLMVALGEDGDLEANFLLDSSNPLPAGTVRLIIDVSGYFVANQAPVVTTTAGTTSFTEDGGAVVVDSGLTVTDSDSPNLASATVAITNPQDAADEVLGATSCAGLTVAPGLNTLNISGSQPLATYQACLQSVTYNNSSQDPDTTPRVIAFVVNDGLASSATASKTVTILAVDDQPVAVDDTATVLEDAAATSIDVLANDTDADGDPFTIASASDPANGTVVVAVDGLSLTYEPDPDYCNTPPGTTLDTFTYALTPGGAAATVSVTVTCVEGDPVAADDTATVAEDAAATPIDVLANDSDDEGDPFSIASFTPPANGTVVLTPAGPGPYSGLTYQPNPDYCNTPPGTTLDTFTYTLTPGSDIGTVTVTVTCDDDSPVAVDDATTILEDAAATSIDVLANDTDADGGTKTIASASAPANGTVVIAGDNLSLTYQPDANYCNNPPGTTLETFTYTLAPGGDSATVTVTVTCEEDNPDAVDDSATVLEDSGATTVLVLTNDTDVDGGPKTITLATDPANGTVVVAGDNLSLTYAPDANYCNAPPGTTLDTFTYTLAPGGDSATVTVTVTCVDDNPVAVADAATVLEDSGATQILVLANDTDIDAGAKTIASATDPANGTVVVAGDNLSLTYAPDANYCNDPPGTTLDTFSYTLSPGGSSTTVTVTVTCVEDNPVAVADAATVLEDSGATTINVMANDTDPDGGTNTIASATDPANGTVVVAGDSLSLSYAPDANYCNNPPGTTLDTFSYTLSPGGSSTTVTVTVTCVDDAPMAVADAAVVLEDAAATAIDVLANDTDIDGGPKTITAAGDPAGGTVVITGGGTGLTFQPDPNFCGATSFDYTLNGSSMATVSVSVTCVNDAPVLADATIDYAIVGNTQLRVGETTPGNSVLHLRDNSDVDEKSTPSDVDGPGPLTVVPFSGLTPGGGDLVLNADGTFTYEPAAGFEGNDVIPFTVTDNGAPAATVNGTMTIAVSHTVWYVHDVVDGDNPAASDTGRSTNAFEDLEDVAAVLTDNDFIFVFEGNSGTTPHGGIRINRTGVKLHGHGVGLTVPGFGTLVAAGNQPRIVNTVDVPAQEDHGVAVDATTASLNGVEIRGLNISSRDNGIEVNATGTNSVGVTISNNTVSSDGTTGLEGIDVNANSTGTTTVTVSNNSLSGRGTAFDARTGAAGALRVDFSNNAGILSSNGSGVVIDGSGGGTTTITGFANNSVNGNTPGTGISVTGATFDQTPTGTFQVVNAGTTTIGASGNGVGTSGMVLTNVQGNLSFTDIDIYADNGAGLRATSPAAYTGSAGLQLVSSPSVATIEATGGPAVDVTTATITLPLSSLRSTNSATTGVALNSVAGTFSAGSGSSISNITSAAGTAFQVGSSSAAVTYDGTITTTQGRGVSLTSNTGTIGFTGQLSLNSGTNPAFSATGGGTVTATNTASTLTTTTGTALTVTGTTIGGAGLRFQSVSANGAANGIVLNGTGAGTLVVSGSGTTDGSGGTIQNTTSDAVVLVNNQGTTLRNMNIGDAAAVPSQAPNATNNIGGDGLDLNNADGLTLNNIKIARTGGHGIDGTGVTNLTIQDSEILNAGDGNTEHGLAFDDVNQNNLDGTVQITNTVIDAFAEDGLRLENFSGTLNLTLNTVTIGRNANTLCGGVTCGENGTQVRADGTANITYTVTNSFFDDVDGNGIFVVAEGPAGVANVNINTTRIENATALGIVLFGGDVVGNPSQLTFNITNNSTGDDGIFNSRSNALSIQPNGSSTVRGTVSGTRIQGSQLGYGIDVPNDDDSKGVLVLSGNTISATECNGIRVLNGNTAELDVHIQGNNVSTPTDAGGNGICHGIEVNARETSETCLNISGNTSDGAGGAVGFRTRQRDTTVFQMERYTGGATNTTDVVNFLVAQNTSGDASATVATGYAGVANGACEDP